MYLGWIQRPHNFIEGAPQCYSSSWQCFDLPYMGLIFRCPDDVNININILKEISSKQTCHQVLHYKAHNVCKVPKQKKYQNHSFFRRLNTIMDASWCINVYTLMLLLAVVDTRINWHYRHKSTSNLYFREVLEYLLHSTTFLGPHKYRKNKTSPAQKKVRDSKTTDVSAASFCLSEVKAQTNLKKDQTLQSTIIFLPFFFF